MTITNLHSIDPIIHKILGTLICLSFFSLALGTAPITISSLATLAVWLLSGFCYRNRADWLNQKWTIPVILLIILPWLGMLWSSSPEHKLNFAERSYYWIFAFIGASTIKSEMTLKRIVISYICGMIITSLPILLYSFSLLPSLYFMNRIATQGYITYSLMIVIAVFLLARLFRESHITRYKTAICFLIALLVLTVTQLSGRSGYLTLMMLSPWIFITMFGKQRIFIITAAFLTVLALLASSQKVRDRITLIPKQINQHQSGDTTDTPIGARLEMWQNASTVFKNNLVIGSGTAGLWHETNIIKPGHGINHPHNSYLYIAANYGIIGILIYGWLFMETMRRAWRTRHTLQGHTILSFLSVIMIGSLTDTQLLSVATGIALGFIVGIPTPSDKTCAYSS